MAQIDLFAFHSLSFLAAANQMFVLVFFHLVRWSRFDRIVVVAAGKFAVRRENLVC
jgi:hypothetical protein